MGVKLRVKSYASNRAYCFFVVMLEQARRDTLVTIRTTRRACRDGDATSGIWAYKTDWCFRFFIFRACTPRAQDIKL